MKIPLPLFALALLAILPADGATPSAAISQSQAFGDVVHYTLRNLNGMEVGITNYGAIITSIRVPDRKGKFADVALGHKSLSGYLNANEKPYFGAVVGRYGNRIAKGKFSIDGVEYTLFNNNNENHLHGGRYGFDKRVWSVEQSGNPLTLQYVSADGEEGYPGEVTLTVTYTLTDENEIVIDYTGTTTKPTHLNPTNHSYFNLKGEGRGNILDHILTIHASRYTPVDSGLIPTGELLEVANTPFDFRKGKSIGRDIGADHVQLKYGGGFDHNWVLDRKSENNKPSLAARVEEPSSGRVLEVYTTEPGIQFYCGNFLNGKVKAKGDGHYLYRGGLCLETQHFPDSPNQKNFPSTRLDPNQTFKSQTIYKFSVK